MRTQDAIQMIAVKEKTTTLQRDTRERHNLQNRNEHVVEHAWNACVSRKTVNDKNRLQ